MQKDAIYALAIHRRPSTPDGISARTLGSLARRNLVEVRHEYEPRDSWWRLTENGKELFKALFVEE